MMVGLVGRDGVTGVVVTCRSPCRHGQPREEREERDDRRGRPVSEKERESASAGTGWAGLVLLGRERARMGYGRCQA
jgi:hypothetical protein